jgi:hypothetical protein
MVAKVPLTTRERDVTDFYVGQRVVCINDRYKAESGNIRPVKGCVYTIRNIDLRRPGCEDPVGLRFEEIVNPLKNYSEIGWDETSFSRFRFRPVKNTSIKVFQKLLAPRPRELETQG